MELSSRRIEEDQKQEFICNKHEHLACQHFIEVTFKINFNISMKMLLLFFLLDIISLAVSHSNLNLQNCIISVMNINWTHR